MQTLRYHSIAYTLSHRSIEIFIFCRSIVLIDALAVALKWKLFYRQHEKQEPKKELKCCGMSKRTQEMNIV